MTEEPKAHGSDAIYLYREEVTDDAFYSQSYFERVKVLTEKGKELATVKVPYEHGVDAISEVEGRTIHSDGTIIPLTVKPSDLMEYKAGNFQVNTVVFTLPSVEVGSILEYRVKIRLPDYRVSEPVWDVQQRYFVRKAHYQFHPHVQPGHYISDGNGNSLNRLMYGMRIGNSNAKMNHDDHSDTYTIDFADVPAIPDEDWMPPLNTLKWRIKFYYTNATSGSNFWVDAGKQWAKKTQSFTNSSGDLKNAVAGLKAYAAQVVNRDRAIFDDSYLSLRQLDDYLAIVVLDGKEVFLDPGQKMCPFGLLHWKHAVASGLRMTDNGPAPVLTPPMSFKASAVNRIADLSISPDGSVSGTIRFIMSGPEGLHWRQLALENDQEELRKRFIEEAQKDLPDGVHAEFDHFLGIDDYSVNLVATVKITGSLGAATGKRAFIPGLFFQARAKHPFAAQEKRSSPVDVHYPRLVQDEVIYRLPEGFQVESAPEATSLSWPEHAVLKIETVRSASNVVSVKRAMAYNYTLLDSKDYSSLHDFFQKVATADQQQLVLIHSPQAKGN